MIFELAGAVGVNPGPLTLRELMWMAESRAETEWTRISALMALTANIHRDPKKGKPFEPDAFNPVVQAKKRPVKMMVPLTVLRDIFCKPEKPK